MCPWWGGGIVEIDHINRPIENVCPVAATFDPVGSTATLVVERYRQAGMEPTPSTATMLLGAALSDTVILNSPTTTERDHTVVDYLERVLELDATEFGREMFESTSDVSHVPGEDIVGRDVKEYEVGPGQTISIAQVETVGDSLQERKDELLDALRAQREREGHLLSALMVTDILAKGSDLLVAGDLAPVERAFDSEADEGVLDLPGVMSRKKQVAPKLLVRLSLIPRAEKCRPPPTVDGAGSCGCLGWGANTASGGSARGGRMRARRAAAALKDDPGGDVPHRAGPAE